MISALILIGLVVALLLYRISQHLADIHDILASLYVFKNLDGERERREQEAEAASTAVEGKGRFFISPQTAISVLRDYRVEVEADFNDLRRRFAAKKTEESDGRGV